jgi:ferric-dicitrate binding protein FerR (iron transport regulator)
MNDIHDLWTDGADPDATARLLRLAGARPAVPGDRAARVRAAAHSHWRTASRRRASTRRGLSAAAFLAAAAALILLVRLFTPAPRLAPGDLVAVVEQTDGISNRAIDRPNGMARTRLTPGDAVRTGEWIETDPRGRLALRFHDGTSVRLDVGSRVRSLASNVIELSAGAVYVDTGRESGRFEVRTALATAQDVGTQFEVRLLDGSLRLRVRTGAVELRDGARSVSGRAGTEITLTGTSATSRPITAYGDEWAWTTQVSPPLDIEGMALSTYLERIAREHGWTLHYADPALAREASGIVLHGSVSGLSTREAIDVAVTTSSLHHRLEAGELVVLRRSR